MIQAASNASIEADYLVVGAGAMGMAFADTMVTESTASIVIVDRHGHPGGHWNDAYAFVHLHSASAHYGVNSLPMGNDTINRSGLNRGFYEAASAEEICAYYREIMMQKLLPSGRVKYFPQCDYCGDGRIVSLITGEEFHIEVRKKIVDATFTETEVPSRHKPKFSVAPSVQCIPPNELLQTARAKRYVVVGAGKTGIDVCLKLLQEGVASESITWIMPRDSWLLDRQYVQPRPEFFDNRMGSLALQSELICKAESVEHLFALLSEHGQLLRIDASVTPQRYRCATVSQAELAELRRIKNVVRLGHVKRIETNRIVLDKGSIDTDVATVHVNCTSSGINALRAKPIFTERAITLQSVRTCQQCFSSALIAHVENSYANDADKNRLCAPIPLPIFDIDWLRMFLANLGNQLQWTNTPAIRAWIAKSRLDLNYGQDPNLSQEQLALVQRFKNSAGPAAMKLKALLSEPALPVAV